MFATQLGYMQMTLCLKTFYEHVTSLQVQVLRNCYLLSIFINRNFSYSSHNHISYEIQCIFEDDKLHTNLKNNISKLQLQFSSAELPHQNKQRNIDEIIIANLYWHIISHFAIFVFFNTMRKCALRVLRYL